MWHCGVVAITTAQLHSTKPELSFCTGSNPACGMSEIGDGEDLWQCSWLEIKLNAFCWSTIPQKQFIIIIPSRGTYTIMLDFFTPNIFIHHFVLIQLFLPNEILCEYKLMKQLNFVT